MTKTDTRQHAAHQRITIYFGYGLFLLSFVAFIVTLLPWYGTGNGSLPIEFNATVITMAAGLATIAPPLFGYLLGYKITRSKDKQTRRYNGVLFGVLGYWLALLLLAIATFAMNYLFIGDWFGSIEGHVTMSIVPAVISLFILGGVAYAFIHRKNSKVVIFNYLPYRSIFIACVAALFVFSGVSIATSSWQGVDFWSSFAVFFLPTLMVAILALFGAWLVGAGNGGWGVRIVKSLVAISFSFAVIAAVSQLLWFNPALASWSVVVSIIVWITYISLLRRHPGSEK